MNKTSPCSHGAYIGLVQVVYHCFPFSFSIYSHEGILSPGADQILGSVLELSPPSDRQPAWNLIIPNGEDFLGCNLVEGREKAVYHLPPCKGPDQDDHVSCFTPAISAWLLKMLLFSELLQFGNGHSVYGSHQVSLKPLSVGMNISSQWCFFPMDHSKSKATSFTTQISKNDSVNGCYKLHPY